MLTPIFPIQQIIPDVKRILEKQSLLILQAPPGAGKSTILPLQLMDESWISGKKIIMLEPRRIAARAVASRMASLCEEPIGKTIGYRIRFENKVSPQTRIEIVTEGILTRMLQNDNTLEGVGMVIFDEFHERSLQADLALALCYQLQQILRPDLKILIMSATLDGAKLSALLNQAPILTSQGRQYPVVLRYVPVEEKAPLYLNMAHVIRKALLEQEGDILAFFPGAGEIQRTQQLLEHEGIAANVLPLYGDLSQQKQQEAIVPDKNGNRKVVLATSIAETSLTIEGIKTVIDCGYARVPRFDPRSGLTKLETIRVTKDAADQRAGRAGRINAGVCYRLWSEGSHIHLIDTRKPEILEADLAPLVLELSKWGIKNMEELTWLTLPTAGAQAQARELLHALQALKDNQITEHGKKMLQLPTHPRIAHMLIESILFEENNSAPFIALACDVAALLEERDPLAKETGTDISLRIEVLRKYRAGERVNADRLVLDRLERLSLSWRKLLRTEVNNLPPNHFHIGKLIATAYPERIAQRIDKNGLRYRLGNGRIARLAEHDPLAADEWIAIAQLDAGTTEGKIFLATAFDSRDLMDLATEKKIITWDNDKKMVVGILQKQVGNLTLESKPIHPPLAEAERISVICKMIREQGLRVLNWGEAQEDLQARIMSLRTWRTTEAWPDVTDSNLLDTLDDWLSPYLTTIYKLSELQKLDLQQIILSTLPWDLSQKLNALAPAKIEVPTGSLIKLKYAMDGSKVEMAVRLQELFGLLETPAVNEGRNKIVIHLLSPGYKPVQITQDLKSFWNKTYFEVRKDLLSRYPKHHWPTDPLTAQAIRGPKKRQT